MFEKSVPSITLFLLLAGTGCGSSISNVSDPHPEQVPLYASETNSSPEDYISGQASVSFPGGMVSLEEAVATAVARNPNLSALTWKRKARDAEISQAGRIPNPELFSEIENFAGGGDASGFTNSETTIGVSQLVELGEKRSKRVAVATYEKALSDWEYESARFGIVSATKKSFYATLAAQEQVALARELENVSKEVLGSVKKRVAAGAASSVEQNRAQVELEMNRIQAQKAQFAFLASKRRLSALWGSSEPDFNALKGALESLPQLPAEEVLIQSTEQNPEIARLIADRDLLQAKLELEQSNGVPDLTIGGGVRYSNETEDSSFLVEFGLPLQFFDRRQDAADAALSRVNGSRESLRSIQVEIRNKIISSYQGYLSAKKEAETLRDRGLVQAQAAFAFARKGYLRGSLSLTDVLDTRRLLFEIKSRYLDTLSRCQMLAADIEELSGGSVELTYQ